MGFKLLEVIGNQSTCCNDATHVFRIVDGSNWMFQARQLPAREVSDAGCQFLLIDGLTSDFEHWDPFRIKRYENSAT